MTPFPNIDYINPGIAGFARLHSIYVPMYSNTPYSIKKMDQDQSLDMEGKGIDSNNKGTESIETIDTSIDEDKIQEDNPEIFNEKKRKLLGDGVYDSFQHPKIKTVKTNLADLKSQITTNQPLPPLKKIKKDISTIKHRFSITD